MGRSVCVRVTLMDKVTHKASDLNLMAASTSLLEPWQVALAHFHPVLRPMLNLNMLSFQEPTNDHIGPVTIDLTPSKFILPSCMVPGSRADRKSTVANSSVTPPTPKLAHSISAGLSPTFSRDFSIVG